MDNYSCSRIYVVKSPLIGMPRYFPKLHHAVVIANGIQPTPVCLHLFDVIPENPTSPETLLSMILGDTVPAIPRCRQVSKVNMTEEKDLVGCVAGDHDAVVDVARMFQQEYFSDGPRMGLYGNNCVHFSRRLVEHLLEQFPLQAKF